MRPLQLALFLAMILCSMAAALRAQGQGAQLRFELRDSLGGKPIVRASCRVYSPEGKLLSYGISDSQGRLSVLAAEGDRLVFASLGYQTLKREARLYQRGRLHVVRLSEGSIRLREVTIKAPPIQGRGDTIAYHAGAFVKAGDRYLEDLLKKLPGIKISESGMVSYQGKAINKFYIEGQDLLGGNYNQATRNMPVEAVATVEVLEHHQPIQVLQGRKPSDQAALNVKLKNSYKLRPFGQVEGGLGGVPKQWDARLFLTQILGTNQALVSAKANGTGEDISAEAQEQVHVTDLDVWEPAPEGVLSNSWGGQPLEVRRYVSNKAYLVGANYLRGFSKEKSLHINLMIHGDDAAYSQEQGSTYGGEQEVSIWEVTQKGQKPLVVLPVLKYEYNGKQSFLTNEVRYWMGRRSSSNRLMSGRDEVREELFAKPSYIQNYLSGFFTIGDQMIRIKSFVRYQQNEESLDSYSATNAAYNVLEELRSRSLITKHLLSTSVRLWGHSLEFGSAIHYRDHRYGHTLQSRRDELVVRLSPTYTINWGSQGVLSLGFPMEWSRTKLSLFGGSTRSRHYLVFEPELYFRYSLSDLWQLQLSASVGTDNLSGGFYSPTSLRTGYRSEYASRGDVAFRHHRQGTLNVRYKNLATMFFARLGLSYRYEKADLYPTYTHTNTLSRLAYLEGDNLVRSLSLHASADKSFVDVGLSLKSELRYELSSSLISQSGIEVDNNSHVLGTNLNLILQRWDWLRCNISLSGALYWERNAIRNTEPLGSLSSDASILIYPIKPLEIKWRYRHYIHELEEEHYKSFGLLDMDINYRLSKRWELGLSLSNILNTEHYVVRYNTGINTFYSDLPLRGRQFLLRLRLRV